MTTKRANENPTMGQDAPEETQAETPPPFRTVDIDGQPRRLMTRAGILDAADVTYEYVPVPEWGGEGAEVRVRSMTGKERDAYDAESYRLQQANQTDAGAMLANFRARRVGRSVVDENGERLFSDKDIAALGEKNAAVIDRLDDAVSRLSGMDADAVKKAVEALKAGLSDGSGSD